MKLKCAMLLNMPSKKNQQNYWSFYPSEPFTLGHFNVRYPVVFWSLLNFGSILAQKTTKCKYLSIVPFFCHPGHTWSCETSGVITTLISFFKISTTVPPGDFFQFSQNEAYYQLNWFEVIKIHSLSKQFCTIFILWKTYHSHQTFPTCQSWHQLFILWKTYHCAELFTQWMGFS